MINLQDFVRERDAALLSLDKKKIIKYLRKYGVYTLPSNEKVFWAAVHKAIFNMESATEEQKARSEMWLAEHGFSTTKIT